MNFADHITLISIYASCILMISLLFAHWMNKRTSGPEPETGTGPSGTARHSWPVTHANPPLRAKAKAGFIQKMMLGDASGDLSPETTGPREVASCSGTLLTEPTQLVFGEPGSFTTDDQTASDIAALVDEATEETAPGLIEDSSAEAFATLIDEAAQAEEIQAEETQFEDTHVGEIRIQEAQSEDTQVEDIIPSALVSADVEIIEPAVQEAALISDIDLSTATDEIAAEPPVHNEVASAAETTFESNLPLVQKTVENKIAPQSFPGPFADEERIAKTFLGFYGLSEQPFGVTPDPAYLYLSQAHREALSSLSQGVQDLRGFMAMVAEPGMGKTTLLNKLMEELRDSARVVFLFQTQCNSRELLRYILGELGVKHAGMDIVAMHRALNEFLFQAMLEGRRFVLIVDEAQNLQDSTLETIRLLSDFETAHAKLLQIVLAGQPQLAEKLTRSNLSQLRQRIAVLAHLEPLGAAETARYIEHRLRVAGASEPLFTQGAIELLAKLSHGTPRNINNICCNALLKGYAQERKIIGGDIIEQVVAKLDVGSLFQRPQKRQAALKRVPAVIPAPAPAVLPAPAASVAVAPPSAPAAPSSRIAVVPVAPPAPVAVMPPAPIALPVPVASARPAPVAAAPSVPAAIPVPAATTAIVKSSQQSLFPEENQPAPKLAQQTEARIRGSLTGKLTELVRSRPWGKDDREYRLQISLEREPSSDIPVADRYYCCSLYISEEEAAALRTGQPIRIKFEQD